MYSAPWIKFDVTQYVRNKALSLMLVLVKLSNCCCPANYTFPLNTYF